MDSQGRVWLYNEIIVSPLNAPFKIFWMKHYAHHPYEGQQIFYKDIGEI